jgi:hypothetical protein
MAKKIKGPIFFNGEIYFLEQFDLKQTVNLKKEFDKVEYDYSWRLSRGTIIQNDQNDKLKFDIIPSNDFYESFFTGFLYPDGSVLGKIKYIQDANTIDAVINGRYEKVNKNRILMCGIWDDTKGSKEYFWLELIHKNN